MIARQFDISPSRAQQIFRQKQDRLNNYDKWPPLKRMLSVRVQNVLVKIFGSEEILNHPEKLASMGHDAFLTWK
ncbi:MAG: hypothetical protein EHM36_11650, partial [Deltaproteobacteria bacterium]